MLRRNDLPFYMEMTACDTLRDRHNLPGQDTDMENQLLYVANGSCYVKVSDRTIKAAYRSIVYFHRYVKYDLEIPSGENNLVYRLHFRPSQNSAHLDLDTLCQNNDIIDGFMNYRNRYCILYDQENTSSTINELIREFHAPSERYHDDGTSHSFIYQDVPDLFHKTESGRNPLYQRGQKIHCRTQQ